MFSRQILIVAITLAAISWAPFWAFALKQSSVFHRPTNALYCAQTCRSSLTSKPKLYSTTRTFFSQPITMTRLDDDEEADDEDEVEYYEEVDGLESDGEEKALAKAQTAKLKLISRNFQKFGWLAWWSQVILSTVSGVIILFSNAITERSIRGSTIQNGVFLAGLGVASSALSIFWTWNTILRARAWVGKNVKKRSSPVEAQQSIAKTLKIGVWINLLGMLFALIGAEQIVGTLVAKILYSGGIGAGQVIANSIPATQQIRALDIFIVQANTNTLLSHFASLALNLSLIVKSRQITTSVAKSNS